MNKPAQINVPAQAHFPARFTTAEFLRMADAGAFNDMKVELIHGELERMLPPHSWHASRQALVIALLWQVARDHGFHLLGEVGIDLGHDTVLACDLAMVDRLITEQRLIRPAEMLLVVEVAESSLMRDLTLKHVAYARAGINEYWVIDGQQHAVHRHRSPQGDRYGDVQIIAFGEPLPVPGTDATIVIA